MIAENKTRTMLTIDKMFLEQLKNMAKLDGRSLNSLMIKALNEYCLNHPIQTEYVVDGRKITINDEMIRQEIK